MNTRRLLRKSIIIGLTASFIGVTGGIIAPAYPVLGTILCLLGFLAGSWMFLKTQIEAAIKDEQADQQQRLLVCRGIGNAAYETYAKIMRETGSFTKARPHLEKAIEIEPDNAEYLGEMSLMIAFQATMRVNTGYSVNKAMLSLSSDYALRAIDQRASTHFAHTALGIICDIRGKHSDARKHFIKASKRGNTWTLINICTSYYMEGLGREALHAIKQHVDKYGENHWLVRLWHGRALLLFGEYSESERKLLEAYHICNRYPGVAKSVNDVIYSQGRMAEAANYLFKEALNLLSLNPLKAIRLFMRGFFQKRMDALCRASKAVYRKYAQAERLIRFLMRYLPPYEPESTLSEMAFVNGHVKEAAILLEKAMPYGESDARLWSNKSSILTAQGNMVAARAAIERACELDPDNGDWQIMRKSIIDVSQGNVKPRFYSSDRYKRIRSMTDLKEISIIN